MRKFRWDMGLKLTWKEMELSLEIRGYRTPREHDDWDNWCKVDLNVKVGDYMDYSVVNDEMLMSCEVQALICDLEKLLNGSITKQTQIGFIEPDLTFELYPRSTLGEDELDVWAELLIALRLKDTNYNGAVLTLPFERGDIEELLKYLKGVVGNG